MLKCPFCHFENEDGALFCEQCKSDLGLAEPVVAGQMGPGTGGAAPHEGIPFSAAPEPVSGVEADIVHEPRIIETIPIAEIAAERLASETGADPDAFPVADSIPVAAPVAEPSDEAPPLAVPIAAPVQGEGDK